MAAQKVCARFAGNAMRTLAVVMAEGLRGRPHPLTRDRATPAVPFGSVADHRFRRFQTSKGIGD
jgi:hypothetical protein